jgi:hypothetical protein
LRDGSAGEPGKAVISAEICKEHHSRWENGYRQLFNVMPFLSQQLATSLPVPLTPSPRSLNVSPMIGSILPFIARCLADERRFKRIFARIPP